MVKSLKSFYEKENFDISSGYVDPFKFHKTSYLFLKVFQVLDRAIPKWTYFLKTLILFCALSALAILGVYHGINSKDLAYTTQAGTYELIMLYTLLILSCTKLNVSEYYKLVKSIREDFRYVCDKGKIYRERFFQNQFKIWKVCLLNIIFMGSVSLGMMTVSITSLLFYTRSDDRKSNGDRPLPFPFWAFDLDFGKTYIQMCVLRRS